MYALYAATLPAVTPVKDGVILLKLASVKAAVVPAVSASVPICAKRDCEPFTAVIMAFISATVAGAANKLGLASI